MLVKILSYAASVVGSARHRAVLASCFVLIIAFAGILSIPFMHNAPTIKLAGSAQDETDTDTQSEPVWLSERQLQQKGPKEETSTQTDPKPADNNAKHTASAEDTSAEPKQSETTAELSLSKTEITLEPGAASSSISAMITRIDNGETWSITTEKATPADDITIENIEKAESSLSFRIRTGSNIKSGTYQITVTAKSADFSLTRTLTVIVQ